MKRDTSRGSAAGNLPVGDPVSSLSATGRNILAAARRLVAERGFSALTFEAIARESGENKSSIRYHFGSKAGLVEALIDSHTYDACQRLIRETDSAAIPDQRIHLLIAGIRRMTEDAESFRAFFELLPEVLRSAVLKERIAERYSWYRALNFQWLGVEQERATRELQGLAMLMVAVIDGLALQLLMDPEDCDLEPAFELMEHFVKTTTAQLEFFLRP